MKNKLSRLKIWNAIHKWRFVQSYPENGTVMYKITSSAYVRINNWTVYDRWQNSLYNCDVIGIRENFIFEFWVRSNFPLFSG